MYELILSRFYSTPLALELNAYLSLERILLARAKGSRISAEEAETWRAAQPYGTPAQSTEATAVVSVFGPIINRAKGLDAVSGLTDAQQISSLIRAAADTKEADRTYLLLDTPGGEAVAVDPITEAIDYHKGIKPIDAFVEGSCCSLGYWIAAQTGSITASPSSLIGSMSTMLERHVFKATAEHEVHIVTTGDKKAATHPDEPFTEEHRAEIMRVARAYNQAFMEAVASGRGRSLKDVEPWFDGRVEIATTARQLGWIDKIGSIHQALAGQKERKVMTTKDLRR